MSTRPAGTVAKTAFYIMLLLMVYVSMEAISAVMFYVDNKSLPSKSQFKVRQNEIAEVEGYVPRTILNGGSAPTILHPYLGYTQDPLNKPRWWPNIDEFGFGNKSDPVQGKKPDTVIVGVFGGSVAKQVSEAATLVAELRKTSQFRGKEVEILSFGAGGYKQPQALLCLVYLISLGGHFDLVINLDGFNEIALPAVGNLPHETFPFYPVYWQARVPGYRQERIEALGRIQLIKDLRKLMAERMQSSVIRYSVTANVFWHYIDTYLDGRINARRRLLLKETKTRALRDFEKHGPPRDYDDEEAMYRDLAEKWRFASVEMMHVANGIGAHYFHILQPNQYVPGSKTLTDAELASAYDFDSIYRRHVERGYIHLRNQARQMAEAGVEFHDMTLIFESSRETVYRDNCCHLNQHGSGVLGKKIGEVVRDYYSKLENPDVERSDHRAELP